MYPYPWLACQRSCGPDSRTSSRGRMPGPGSNLSFESHACGIFQAPQQLGGHDNAPCVKACSCLDFALLVETDGRVNEFCSLFLEMSKWDRDVADKGFFLCFAFWQYASRTFRGRASCFCGRRFQLAPLTCALVLRAEASLICWHLSLCFQVSLEVSGPTYGPHLESQVDGV